MSQGSITPGEGALERGGRTDDKADYSVIPEGGRRRVEFVLCVSKSFLDVQTVEIDHSICAALEPRQKGRFSI